MASKIKTGENVIVIAGADKGKVGRLLKIIDKSDRVVVEGVNRVWKHVKPSQRNPQGGRIQKDAPIHRSNVAAIDPQTGKATRTKFATKDGVKIRTTSKGAELARVGKKIAQ